MEPPPIPADEQERLAALHALRILDTPAEERFDRITRTARDLFQLPIALISLVDSNRQWFKSRSGLTETESPRAVSFCGHAILGDGPLVIEDAQKDTRFADNPLVTGHPHIRFYAGMPLRAVNGKKLGNLCLIGTAPRQFNAAERARLTDMAAWAERELNLSVEIEQTVANMRERFVRLVSHELRTPVTSLVGALDSIRGTLDRGGEIQTLTQIANDGAGQLKRIVDDIVALAEVNAGEIDLAAERIDIRHLLGTVVELAGAAASKANIRIAFDVPSGLLFKVAPKPLQRIIGCLLDIAIRFSSPCQEVRLSTGTMNGRLRICVEDRGIGISEADLPHLFQPFAPIDAADNRRLGGLGIGLSLPRQLAIALGGTLGHEAREGGGSRFFFEFS